MRTFAASGKANPRTINERGGGVNNDGVGISLWTPKRQARQGLVLPVGLSLS